MDALENCLCPFCTDARNAKYTASFPKSAADEAAKRERARAAREFIGMGRGYKSPTPREINRAREFLEANEVPEQAMKDATGKPQLSLVPGELMEAACRALEQGLSKYERDNWKLHSAPYPKYLDALLRHTLEIQKGGLDAVDHQSGLKHTDHLSATLAIILWHKENDKSGGGQPVSRGLPEDTPEREGDHEEGLRSSSPPPEELPSSGPGNPRLSGDVVW